MGHMRVRETRGGLLEMLPHPHSVDRRKSHIRKPKLAGGVPVGQKAGYPGKEIDSNTGALHSPLPASTWLSQLVRISGDVLCLSPPELPKVRVFTLAMEGTSYLPCLICAAACRGVWEAGPESQLLDHLAHIESRPKHPSSSLPAPLLFEVTWVILWIPSLFLTP